MIAASYLVLTVAAALFVIRAIVGPSLTDRVIGIDGAIVAGMSLIMVNAAATGRGAFLPTAVVLALVSFVSTAIVARYIEGRDDQPGGGDRDDDHGDGDDVEASHGVEVGDG